MSSISKNTLPLLTVWPEDNQGIWREPPRIHTTQTQLLPPSGLTWIAAFPQRRTLNANWRLGACTVATPSPQRRTKKQVWLWLLRILNLMLAFNFLLASINLRFQWQILHINDWILDLCTLPFQIASRYEKKMTWFLRCCAVAEYFPSNIPFLIFASSVLRYSGTQEEHTNLKAEEATLAWREWFMSVD